MLMFLIYPKTHKTCNGGAYLKPVGGVQMLVNFFGPKRVIWSHPEGIASERELDLIEGAELKGHKK